MRRGSFQGSDARSRTDTDFSVTDDASLFFASCKVNDSNVVRLLLEADKNLPRMVRKGTTPLHVAARAGSIESLMLILKADPGATSLKDKAGFTPFARAAECGRLRAMKEIFAIRADCVRDRDTAMFTPLHRSAGNGHLDATIWLVENGAYVNDVDLKTVETPLFHACRMGSPGVVQYLIEKGADVNARNSAQATPVFLCVMSFGENIGDSSEVLNILLNNKASVDLQNSFSQTPLSLAVDTRNKKAIVTLLKNGANPNFAATGREAPFVEILLANDLEMIAAFKEGLGDAVVLDKLCELSSKMDPYYIVGKSLYVCGHGAGFCVEAFRPYFGLFGTINHIVRFMDTGEEKTLILKRHGVDGEAFYLVSDSNHPTPLVPFSQDI